VSANGWEMLTATFDCQHAEVCCPPVTDLRSLERATLIGR
jgi:hypothetical protein